MGVVIELRGIAPDTCRDTTQGTPWMVTFVNQSGVPTRIVGESITGKVTAKLITIGSGKVSGWTLQFLARIANAR